MLNTWPNIGVHELSASSMPSANVFTLTRRRVIVIVLSVPHWEIIKWLGVLQHFWGSGKFLFAVSNLNLYMLGSYSSRTATLTNWSKGDGRSLCQSNVKQWNSETKMVSSTLSTKIMSPAPVYLLCSHKLKCASWFVHRSYIIFFECGNIVCTHHWRWQTML